MSTHDAAGERITNSLVKMAHKVFETGVVGVRQVIHNLMCPDVSQAVVVEACGIDKALIKLVGEQRFWKLAEPQFEGTRDDVDVGTEFFRHWVDVVDVLQGRYEPKFRRVQGRSLTSIECSFQSLHFGCRA